MSLALALYRALTGLAEPLAWSVLRARARQGKEESARLAERMGYPGAARPEGPLVWLHGASVGESLSILPLIERMRDERPDLALLVTSGTVTSAALMAGRLPPGATHQYAPLDGPHVAARFLAHWRPQLAVFVESELWPNQLLQAKAAGARLALLSARITAESAAGWRWAPGAARRMLGAFDLVMAQDEASAERLAALGATVQGRLNLKLAAAPLPVDADACAALEAAIGERAVVLAASTHPGEEEIVAAAVQALPERPLLIVAPRHPGRGEAVAALLSGRGMKTARRSLGELPGPDTDAYVADTLGEMGLFYALAQVAVMGGGFVPGVGGHNPLEPARSGVGVITGPHAFNFAEVYGQMLAGHGALLAEGEAELGRLLGELLADDERLLALGSAGLAFARSHNAALDEAWARLTPLLPA